MAIEKFVFAPFSLRLCQRFREKSAIVSIRRTSRDDNCSPLHHAYFAEQLSLLQCAVRYKRVLTRLRIARRWRKALVHVSVRCTNGESPCRAGDAEETILRSVRHRYSRLTTTVLAYATASALLTNCNSFPMPRLRQTCGRKYRT